MRLVVGVAYGALALVLLFGATAGVQSYYGPFPYPSPFVTLDVMRYPRTIDAEAQKRIASILSDRLRGLTTEQRFEYLRGFGYRCDVSKYDGENYCSYGQPTLPLCTRRSLVRIANEGEEPAVPSVIVGLVCP